MAFRHNEMGALVSSDPKRARAALEALFRTHEGNAVKVATELGVDYRTVTRWMTRLAKAGQQVKRPRVKEPRRGRPAARPARSGTNSAGSSSS